MFAGGEFLEPTIFVELDGGKRGTKVYLLCVVFLSRSLGSLKEGGSNSHTCGLTSHVNGGPISAVH